MVVTNIFALISGILPSVQQLPPTPPPAISADSSDSICACTAKYTCYKTHYEPKPNQYEYHVRYYLNNSEKGHKIFNDYKLAQEWMDKNCITVI